MIKCSFEEEVDLPGGRFRYTKCINKAEILITNDPCFGLCYTCAYKKLAKRVKELEQKNELLESYIACEVDNMAAYAPFDELGNKMRYVQRAFFSVGHIIPELEELKREVEITCTPEPQETK